VDAPVIVSIDDDAELPGPGIVAQTLADLDAPGIGAVAIPHVDAGRAGEGAPRAPDGEHVWVTYSDFTENSTQLGFTNDQVYAVRCNADLTGCTAVGQRALQIECRRVRDASKPRSVHAVTVAPAFIVGRGYSAGSIPSSCA